ncbi:MAG TPA: gamma carbonic anhydrase family protein [Gemmatimonadaceae bacterium]|nr:gamma carbonic anhydrase family protein [Gemmatimonadaceae bacterium]
MTIDPTAFIHPEAFVCGNLTLGARASVWPSAVIRADSDAVSIGEETNVQDGCVIHVDPGLPCRIGARVTVGHRAIVHGATVEDECLIGMGAIVLNRVVVGRGSLVGAGAVCSEGMVIPPGSLVLGVPAKVVRQVDEKLRSRLAFGVEAYIKLAERHRTGEFERRRTS